jgi:hypothetical protein
MNLTAVPTYNGVWDTLIDPAPNDSSKWLSVLSN